MTDLATIDDFDWSGAGTPAEAPSDALPAGPPIRRERAAPGGRYDESLLPPSYREYGAKNTFRKSAAPKISASIDDMDWGDVPLASSQYNPADDWALTRGVKAGYEGGNEAIAANADMFRISSLPPEQQVAAMIELGKRGREPGATELQVPGIEEIGSHGGYVGDFFTWLGESAGQMLGSMASALTTGGAAGAGVGAAAGSVLPGPGTLAGASTGALYGTGASFLAMGTGGTLMDLVRDPGVQKALADGTLTPNEVKAYAIGGGLVIGALDAVAPGRLLKTAAGDVAKDEVKKRILQAAIAGATKTGIEEGTTEAMQGAISEIGQAALGGDANLGERILSVVNQGLAGAVGGAGPGAAAGVLRNNRIARPVVPKGEDGPKTGAPGQVTPGGGPPAGQPAGSSTRSGPEDAAKSPQPGQGAPVVETGDVPSDVGAALSSSGAAAQPREPALDPDAPRPQEQALVDDEEFADDEEEGEFGEAPSPGLQVTTPPPKAPTPAGGAPVVEVDPGEAQPDIPEQAVEQPKPNEPLVTETGSIDTDVEVALTGQPTEGEAAPDLQEAVATQPLEGAPSAEPRPPPPAEGVPAAVAPHPAGPRVLPDVAQQQRLAAAQQAAVAASEETEDEAKAALEREQIAGTATPTTAAAPLAEPTPTRRVVRPENKTKARRIGGRLRRLASRLQTEDDYRQAALRLKDLSPDEREYFLSVLPPDVADYIESIEEVDQPVAENLPAAPAGEAQGERSWSRATGVAPRAERAPAPAPAKAKPKPVETVRKPLVINTNIWRNVVANKGVQAATDLINAKIKEAVANRRTVSVVKDGKVIGGVWTIGQFKRLVPQPKPSPEVRKAAGYKKPKDEYEDYTGVQMKEKGPAIDIHEFFAGHELHFAEGREQEVRGPEKPLRQSKAKAPVKTVPVPEPVAPEGKRARARREVPFNPKSHPPEGVTPGKGWEYVQKKGWVRTEKGIQEQLPLESEERSGRPQPVRKVKESRHRVPEGRELEQRLATEIRQVSETEAVAKHGPLAGAVVSREREQHLETLAKRAGEDIASKLGAGAPGALVTDLKLHDEFNAIVDKAIETYERLVRSKEAEASAEALKEIKAALAEAKKYQAIYDADVKTRRKKTGEKDWQDVLTESPATQRRLVKENKAKPVEERDPLINELEESFEATAEINKGTDPAKRAMLQGERDHRARIQKQRAAAEKVKQEQREEDRRKAIDNEKELLKEMAELVGDLGMSPALAADLRDVSAETKDDLLSEAQTAKINMLTQFQTRLERAVKSTPVLRDLYADTEMPEIENFWDTGSWHRINKWGNDFVREAKAKLSAAGVKLPKKTSIMGNSPEENALIWMSRMLKKFEDTKEGREIRRTTKNLNIYDAYATMLMLKEAALSDDPEVRRRNYDTITGMMRDEVATKSTAQEGQGRRARDRERLRNESIFVSDEAAQEQQAAGREQKRQTEAEAYRQEVEEKYFRKSEQGQKRHLSDSEMNDARAALAERFNRRSPDELGPQPDPEGRGEVVTVSITGKDGKTRDLKIKALDEMTGEDALDRFVPKRLAPTGWRGVVHRGLMRTLRQLVPNVRVLVVEGGYVGPTAGVYLGVSSKALNDGKRPTILINEQALGRPKMLAHTVMHEMTHAATEYALNHDIRGTATIVRQLMNAMRNTLGDIGTLPANSQYAFKNEHEFLTAAMNDGEFQDMAASLRVPLKLRAQIRALGRGRDPTFWDTIMAAVENAIGFFTPGKLGVSYMDQVLRLYPHAAMSETEVAEDARLRDSDIPEGGNAYLNAPFDSSKLGDIVKRSYDAVVNGQDWRRSLSKKKFWVIDNETLRRQSAEEFFEGNHRNPFSDMIDWLMTHRRDVETLMREGDRMDSDLRRWMMKDPRVRRSQIDEAFDVAQNASVDGVDPRVDLKDNTWIRNDADHPLAGGKKRKGATLRHDQSSFKREAHERYKKRWDKLPPELQSLLSKRLDHMKEQMIDHQRQLVTNLLNGLMKKTNSPVVLPAGMEFDDAVEQILNNDISEELEKALGKNADTLDALGRMDVREQMYAPTFREGEDFISAKRKIETPAAPRGKVRLDQDAYDKRDIFRWEFTDRQDAVDYMNRMGTTGEERVLKLQRKFFDIDSGKFIPTEDHQTGNFNSVPLYYVTMQDRYMTMGDSVDELLALRQELLASGEYLDVSSPMKMGEFRDKGTPALLPQQLQRVLDNITSWSGVSEEEKKVLSSMLVNSNIRLQQGNRLTKRMLKRKGVLGSKTDADSMFKAFAVNNQMMARAIASLRRIPTLEKNKAAIRDMMEAARTRRAVDMDKLPAELRQLLTRNYAKQGDIGVTRLGDVETELNKRIEDSMKPMPAWSRGRGEDWLNAATSIVTMTYLGTGAYLAMQVLGMMQTFPRLAAKVGVGRAYRLLMDAYHDVGWGSAYASGFGEAWQETKEFFKKLAPRADYVKEASAFRTSRDLVEERKQRLRANGARNLDLKLKAIDRAYQLNAVGQAGLDQANLRMVDMNPNLLSKGFRGVEQMARVFRAAQEGIEVVNRFAPIMAHVDALVEQGGLSEDEIITRAVTNMTNEQTNYSAANWPRWMSHPIAGPMILFKKFGLTQAITFYESLFQAAGFRTDASLRKRALMHLVLTTAVLAAIGGFSGNPLWEPVKLMTYLLGLLGIMDLKSWEMRTTDGERMIAGLMGDKAAEVAMYGLPRLAGIDVSGRVAMDSLLYLKEPEEMTKTGALATIGGAILGAGGDTFFNTAAAGSKLLTEGPNVKTVGELPWPKTIKDIFKTVDQAQHGVTTTSGALAGERPNMAEAMVQILGFRTRDAARPFEQGSVAKRREEQFVADRRKAIVQRTLNGGMSASNMREINRFNARHPDPKLRITAKTIRDAAKRRRTLERDIAEANVE